MAVKKKGSRGLRKRARTRARKSKRSTTSLTSVPKGFHSVTPYLAITGASEAIEFYKKAFGARELARETMPDGKILHARFKIGDSLLMLADEFPGSNHKSPTSAGTSTVTLHIYTTDVDSLWQKAIEAGAKVTMPLENQFWGERYGQLTDPFGHHWSISQQVKMSREEMDEKRKSVMTMLAQGQHP